ncbi:MAG TPA: hypothetical protein VFX15_02740 [Actinomycetes bacterium]|nr:hypothetical protein [Actinomycetes bacterium]
MNGPYVNGDGDVWIERGTAPWPRIQREAFNVLYEMGWGRADGYSMEYQGAEKDVRVSDEHEYPHGDDDGCADYQGKDYNDPGFEPCCRSIEAHHFRGVER